MEGDEGGVGEGAGAAAIGPGALVQGAEGGEEIGDGSIHRMPAQLQASQDLPRERILRRQRHPARGRLLGQRVEAGAERKLGGPFCHRHIG